MPLAYDVELHGPLVAGFACTLGVPCSLDVWGFGLGASNRLAVLHPSADCSGHSSPTPASWCATVV